MQHRPYPILIYDSRNPNWRPEPWPINALYQAAADQRTLIGRLSDPERILLPLREASK